MELKEVKMFIRRYIHENLLKPSDKIKLEDIQSLAAQAWEILRRHQKIDLGSKDREEIVEELADEILGFGPLRVFIEDDTITEIMVNGPYKIYVEKEGRKYLTPVKFDDERHLRYIIERMVSPTRKRLDELNPYVDFSLPDGSRVNIIIPPLAPFGPVITIRKFSKTLNTIEDLVSLGTLDVRMAEFLVASVKAKINIIFSGATGSGKTTTLNILSGYIPEDERIITIEDVLELRLRQEHVVRLESRQASIEGKGEVTIRDLFINTLRMRPQRIILGEVRGREALDLLQANVSGHSGSLAVIHASSPQDVISRLEFMVLEGGLNLPIWIIRRLISSAIDLIVQQEQLPDGSRKITSITEVSSLKENSTIDLRDIYYFDFQKFEDEEVRGRFRSTGIKPSFLDKFKKYSLRIEEKNFIKD